MRFIFQGQEYNNLSCGACLCIIAIIGSNLTDYTYIVTVDDLKLPEDKIKEIEMIIQKDKK